MPKPLDYAYHVYRGDEAGDQQANGPYFWAVCLETTDRGDGRTQDEALRQCMSVVQARLQYYAVTKFPIPLVGSRSIASLAHKGLSQLIDDMFEPLQPCQYEGWWCRVDDQGMILGVERQDLRDLYQAYRLAILPGALRLAVRLVSTPPVVGQPYGSCIV